MMQNERIIVTLIFAALIGIILAVAHAPFWAQIIAVVVLCCTALPWAMLREELLTDRFSLDAHREILIDGEPHIITAFSADGSMRDHTRITVDFEPTEQYINRNINHDIGAP